MSDSSTADKRTTEEKARDGYERLWASCGGVFAGESVYTWNEVRKEPALLSLWMEKVAFVEEDPDGWLTRSDLTEFADITEFARGVLQGRKR